MLLTIPEWLAPLSEVITWELFGQEAKWLQQTKLSLNFYFVWFYFLLTKIPRHWVSQVFILSHCPITRHPISQAWRAEMTFETQQFHIILREIWQFFLWVSKFSFSMIGRCCCTVSSDCSNTRIDDCILNLKYLNKRSVLCIQPLGHIDGKAIKFYPALLKHSTNLTQQEWNCCCQSYHAHSYQSHQSNEEKPFSSTLFLINMYLW